MRTRLVAAAGAAALLAAVGGLFHYSSGMAPAEAIHRLSGLRMSLALYTLEKKAPPSSFAEVLRSGQLEAAPAIKLAWHPRTTRVRDVPARAVTDTGGWAYVNAPASPDFGLLFIDCAHKDAKGRFWSEF